MSAPSVSSKIKAFAEKAGVSASVLETHPELAVFAQVLIDACKQATERAKDVAIDTGALVDETLTALQWDFDALLVD